MIALEQVHVGAGTLVLRPESWDYGIARSVMLDNEYQLPDSFCADDLIIDIGAHIGAFACACLQRGAGKVIAFEPEPDNFALATSNLAIHGDQCELHAEAVWRSDGDEFMTLQLRRARHPLNTGGHDVLGDDTATWEGLEVPGVALDTVLARLDGPVRLLKIDTEGAEYPVLLTATRLAQVMAIAGEYHRLGPASVHGGSSHRMRVMGMDHYNGEALFAHLRMQGFEVESKLDPSGSLDHGLFFAHRPGWALCSR